jgi:hypothetical protein
MLTWYSVSFLFFFFNKNKKEIKLCHVSIEKLQKDSRRSSSIFLNIYI